MSEDDTETRDEPRIEPSIEASDKSHEETFWTAERTNLLIKLWDENELSGGRIALVLDPNGGLSRSAVSGKASRLGLKRKKSKPPDAVPHGIKIKFRPKHERRSPVPPPPLRQEITDDSGISMMAIGTGQCRAPLDRRDEEYGLTMYCGRNVHAGSSYCREHHIVFSAGKLT